MAVDTLPVESDPTLLADIRRYGKFDPTGCYQCGSCTLSCDLVGNSVTFPRKSIRYALLGLKVPLLGDLEPWICHDCGDCSTACPRQAEPRISMATLRRFLSGQYERTGIAAKLLTSRAWYFGSLASAAAAVVLLILCYHLWYVGLPLSGLATPMGMEHMFPIMTYYTVTVVLFPLLLLATRVHRVWLLTMGGEQRPRIPLSVYAAEAWWYVFESASQSLMRKCPQKGRWLGHFILASGTVTMLAIKVFALRWFQTDKIYPFYNPQRWLGYIAAACIFYGIADILIGRVQAKKEIYKETRAEDMVFPMLLVLTACSGIGTHIFRYTGLALAAHVTYALHVIIATPMLVVEMPFGKAAHMIYRPLALYFQAVREKAAQQTTALEVIPHAL
ncbi:MAG: 4Fe-4S dicluster domain-containing protein [Candidatus Sulfotelmatobacter sp.]